MAGAILSSMIKWAADKISTFGTSSPSSSSLIEQEIHKLKCMMKQIQTTLDNAEERDIRENLEKLHLSDLKEVVYDAEDLVGEYEYEILECIVKGCKLMEENSQKRKNKDAYDTSNFTNITIGNDFACRVNEIAQRFDKITRNWTILHLPERAWKKRRVHSWKPAVTSGFCSDESIVLGRESEEMKLIELLLSEDNGNENLVSVIPILGMGGIGKTTLAQIVYNNPKVCQHFNLRGWACMWEYTDIISLTKSVAMSFFGKEANHSELNKLIHKLMTEIKGKRFLLVLDDVWKDKLSLCESLRNLLLGAGVGKVIVTTRDESIADAMKTTTPFHLSGLSFAKSWLLFKKISLDGKDLNVLGDFEETGKIIVAKCKGLPLAIKVLGCALRYENEEEVWLDISKSELWQLDDDSEFEILPALKLSYDRMPTHLKRCFICLSLFPKSYVLYGDKLIALWMSQGLLQPQGRKLEMEVGKEYLTDLLQRSVLQYHLGRNNEFAMHDLLHDLASSVAGHEYLQIEVRNLMDIPKNIHHLKKVRHLTLLFDNKITNINLKPLLELKVLRTLLILRNVKYFSKVDVENLDGLLMNSTCLRALDLCHTDIKELPESIGGLRQLRYLCIDNIKIRSLPESLCCLYHLQNLHAESLSIQELPKNLGNLINLRDLKLDSAGRLCMPREIGGLTKLQRLPIFDVGSGSWHCGLKQLKDLPLGGSLRICGLEHVVYSDISSKEAYLKSKPCIESLMIEWDIGDWDIFGREEECSHQSIPCDIDEDASQKWCIMKDQTAVTQSFTDKGIQPLITEEELAEQVLESLCPHSNLKELRINFFNGTVFPRWLSDPFFFKLTTLTLYVCRKCKLLPPLGQLPYLTSLTIKEMISVQGIGRDFCSLDPALKGFPSLESLRFSHMPEWVDWHEAEDSDFPCLQQLTIHTCPKLRTVPQCLRSLIKLSIWDSDGLTELPLLPFLTDLNLYNCNRLNKIPMLPSLASLCLRGKWTCICSCHLPIHHSGEDSSSSGTTLIINSLSLPSLKKLELTACSELRSIMEICNFFSLKFFSISRCQVLQFSENEQLPPGLQNVHLRYSTEATKWFQKHIPNMREVTPHCFTASFTPLNQLSTFSS